MKANLEPEVFRAGRRLKKNGGSVVMADRVGFFGAFENSSSSL